MLMTIFAMLVRIAITCITLALRLALAMAALIGTLLGHLLAGLWRYWRNRQTTTVPLRAPEHIENRAPDISALPAPPPTHFAPRPLRPRAKR